MTFSRQLQEMCELIIDVCGKHLRRASISWHVCRVCSMICKHHRHLQLLASASPFPHTHPIWVGSLRRLYRRHLHQVSLAESRNIATELIRRNAVNQPLQPDNLASSVKPASGEKLKPCCVCKDEKAQRDECMLFSKSDDPQEECKNMVVKYKECMAGYGFKI